MSSPFRKPNYPSEYDPLQTSAYDPSFTANISDRMRVPDKIGVTGDVVGEYEEVHNDHRSISDMQVPDRILLAGSDQHIGLKESSRDFHLDLMMDSQQSTNNYVGLTTPPRVLTVEETKFPTLEDDEERSVKNMIPFNTSLQNGLISPERKRSATPPLLPFTPGMTTNDTLVAQGDDDMTLVRRQMGRLVRHVRDLEADNQRRSQREMILYPVVIGYFLFKMMRWFLVGQT